MSAPTEADLPEILFREVPQLVQEGLYRLEAGPAIPPVTVECPLALGPLRQEQFRVLCLGLLPILSVRQRVPRRVAHASDDVSDFDTDSGDEVDTSDNAMLSVVGWVARPLASACPALSRPVASFRAVLGVPCVKFATIRHGGIELASVPCLSE